LLSKRAITVDPLAISNGRMARAWQPVGRVAHSVMAINGSSVSW
jgi:hypothetical protein